MAKIRHFTVLGAVFPHFCSDKREIWHGERLPHAKREIGHGGADWTTK